MRRIVGPAFGLILTFVLIFAGSAAAQARTDGSDETTETQVSEERIAESSAADRAVWDFVHFVSPTELVDVVDAFDGEDPFDLNLSVGYQRSLRRAKITRECRNTALCSRDDGAGSDFIDYTDIARYTQETHLLNLGLQVGLFHDLQLYANVPLILSDTRSLTYEEGTNHATVDGILAGPGGSGEPLFSLPFDSPERSGIDYFAVGFSYAPFNQERDPTEPNWVLNVEGRFGVGEQLYAADAADGGGGMSRGVNEIRFATFLSRRYRYLEPYTGLIAMVGIPKYDTGHHFKDPVQGQINTMPPIEGTLLFGMDIIPWENLERFQKFWIGLDISGTFHSEGRTFSELFDALGTSNDPRLTYAGNSGPGCEDPDDPRSPCWGDSYNSDSLYRFSGMTDIENYGTFAGRLTLGIQAAKYVKFTAGLAFSHDQEHYVTFTDECNSEVSGVCGVGEDPYNPMTREVIDTPGNRFRVQETTVFDVFVTVTAMF